VERARVRAGELGLAQVARPPVHLTQGRPLGQRRLSQGPPLVKEYFKKERIQTTPIVLYGLILDISAILSFFIDPSFLYILGVALLFFQMSEIS
jgi:hypothetical protein